MSGKENIAVLEQHSVNSLNNMVSPTKAKLLGTTRVIDNLHSEIDELKLALETSEAKVKEYKQKCEVINKRSVQVIETLTNTKHENEMMSSMLQRKERRIKDLEEQLTEVSSRADKLEFDQKTKDSRISNYEENETRLVGEMETLKNSYDVLIRSQKEAKKYYQEEIDSLKEQHESFWKERELKLNLNIDKFNSNDLELIENFKKMSDKSSKLEILYQQKNNAIVEALKVLALAAKDHGNKTIKVLNECEEVLKAANRKLPNLEEPGEDSSLDISEESIERVSTPQLTASTPQPPMSLTLPKNFSTRPKIRTESESETPSRKTSSNHDDDKPLQRRMSRRSSRKPSNQDRRKSRIISGDQPLNESFTSFDDVTATADADESTDAISNPTSTPNAKSHQNNRAKRRPKHANKKQNV